MGKNPCSIIHWMASNPVGVKQDPSLKPVAGADRFNATWLTSGVKPERQESLGTTPVDNKVPLYVFPLETECQMNFKMFLKVGTDRVVRKELVCITPVCICGTCPSHFCWHWIFLLVLGGVLLFACFLP